MGVQDLQTFLETEQIQGSCNSVDLVKIARAAAQKCSKQVHKKSAHSSGKFLLVVDGECCLDRLYGGFFSDWVCGGQWNRMASFLGQFASCLSHANIEVVFFFNGCSEQSRLHDWIQSQLKLRNNILQVLRHINNKGTPPPKVLWTPPPCLRPSIRMALRNLNIPVIVTMDDHKQEVIAYCRENNCCGILADDADYIAFDPPRYFSSQSLKLTYKGTLETKEYFVAEMAKGLGLTGDQVCVLAALLGNYVLPETELVDLHRKLIVPSQQGKVRKEGTNESDKRSGEGKPTAAVVELQRAVDLVKAVAGFVQTLNHTARDLEKLGLEVFGTAGSERAAKLKQAVQYYLDGTKSGFLNYRPNQVGRAKKSARADENKDASEPGMDTSRLASEADGGNELDGLISLSEATACLTAGTETVTEDLKEDTVKCQATEKINGEINGGSHLIISLNNSGSSSNASTPRTNESSSGHTPGKGKVQKQVRILVEEEKIGTLPPVAPEVMRTVNERHAKGLMSPMIHQILTQGEIRLGVVLEDESSEEVPNILHFYRPMRQMVYAVLFNLHHQIYLARTAAKENKGETKAPEVKIREWIWSKSNPYQKPEIVKAEQLGWGVPTVQRLWFGTNVDDKRRRLRAYLTCMRSDTQLMLDSSHVPQHLLVLATVLRYIMSFTGKRVLRKYELDAIIATAMDPYLANSEHNQELKLECVSARSVQVGSLIMSGIEHALLVNDTCGAPIPWVMASPWLYFDGKLLHATMTRAASVKNALELCSHHLPQVVKVERMREAILEGVHVQWARPPFAPQLAAGMPSGGGRLEIAGVVVGHWGPNSRLTHHEPPIPPPQVTSVGGITRGRGAGGYGGGRGGPQLASQLRGARRHLAPSSRQLTSNHQGGRKGSGHPRGGGKRRGGQTGARGVGRGTTAVSPFTGETVEVCELLEGYNGERVDGGNEDRGQRKNHRSGNKQQPTQHPTLRILSPQDHHSSLIMNGNTGAGVLDPEQFADATNSITADMMCMNMNGEAPGSVTSILAAASSIHDN